MLASAPFDNATTRGFWDGVAASELRLPKCARCGNWQWYPLPGVPHACGGDLVWTALAAEGVVFSHTTVRRPFLPGATRDDVPLTTALIALTDAPGVRLVVRWVDDVAPTIGERAVGRFVDVDGRKELRFEPA